MRVFFFSLAAKKGSKESRREKKLRFSRLVLLWATVLLRCRANWLRWLLIFNFCGGYGGMLGVDCGIY